MYPYVGLQPGTRVEVAYPTLRFLNCTERVSPAAITLTRPRLCKLVASSRVGLSTWLG